MKRIEPDVIEYGEEEDDLRSFYREALLEAERMEKAMGELPSISEVEADRFLRAMGMEELTTRRRQARRRKLRRSRREVADKIVALLESFDTSG